MQTVYFYSSVKHKNQFLIQSFYRYDIQILKELGYNVVLCNTFWPFLCFWKYHFSFIYFYRYGLVPAFLSRLFGKKVYFTGGIDYLDPDFATPKQRRIQAFFFKLCNLFSTKSILVSTADEQNIRQIYNGKLPKNCSLCFHGIEIEQFRFDGDFATKENQFCSIAWMGKMDNVFRKGIDLSIDLFSEIVKLQPDSKLILAGYEGIGSQYVREKIERLGLTKKCFYIGTVDENRKIELMKQSRYYFQLSKYEGFGIAAVEALAAGCVVIHSGKGGLRDAVGDFGCQVNIDQKIDVREMVAAAQNELKNEEKLRRGIAYACEKFSITQRKKAFEKILKK